MECVRCHAGDHWDGAVFCHHCGTRLRNRCVEETCPAEDLESSYRFCPLCGKESLFASLGLMEAAATLADAGAHEEAVSDGSALAGEDGDGLPGKGGEGSMTAPEEADENPGEALVDGADDETSTSLGGAQPADLQAVGIPDEPLEAAGEAGAADVAGEAVAREIPVASGGDDGVGRRG